MRHHIPPEEWFTIRSADARSEFFEDATEDEFNEGCETEAMVQSALIWGAGTVLQ